MDFGLSVLLAVFLVALVAGFAGSMVGVGGGIFLVPFLTLVLGLDVRMAIATSLIGVIATSSGAASVYVRDRLTNLRLGMFLEVATSLGAILGAFVAAVYLGPVVLQVVFGIVAVYAALFMLRTREGARERAALAPEEPGLAKTLNLSSYYFDPEDRAVYRYRVARPGAGFAVSAVAGALSGL
ncbi:MAG TPA: sulfite exporter TauE/SafE family protein, partial [Thermoplasmata archaeon]|nr:sulfite exporter TauE/SafE family protein [Thermoplasmata archaeon]